jgi:tRNA pseudouridine32 synthase/23S rRNA pseudouridine746 synthase/23S rRNA pseudouridine1911/1915/1917 synthase
MGQTLAEACIPRERESVCFQSMRLAYGRAKPDGARMKPDSRKPRRNRLQGLEIIFEDRDLIVICKEPGLLTNSPHRDEPRTAERMLTAYLRKGNARSRLRAYTVHRLDRETSGLLVFAKSEKVQQQIKNHWRDTKKNYYAVVHGTPEPASGKIMTQLLEDQDQFVRVTENPALGKEAETHYRVTGSNSRYSALDVELKTGRKNQIRVHMAHRGHPVVGDQKYGKKDDRFRRMALHAMHLEFDHPFSGRRMIFGAPVPPELLQLTAAPHK